MDKATIGPVIRRWVLPLALGLLAMGLGSWLRQSPTLPKVRHLPINTQVVRIDVTANGTVQHLVLKDGRWGSQVDEVAIDSEAVHEWINLLATLPIIRDISVPPSSLFGLETPSMAISLVTSKNQVTRLYVGKTAPSGGVYLQYNNSVKIVDRELLHNAWVTPEYFRWRYLLPPNQPSNDDIRFLQFDGNLTTLGGGRNGLRLVRGPATGLWVMSSTQNIIADRDRVNDLITTLKSATIVKFVEEPEGALILLRFGSPQSLPIRLKVDGMHHIAVETRPGEWGLLFPIIIRRIWELCQFPTPYHPLELNRRGFDSVDIKTTQNRYELTKTKLGHWRTPSHSVRTVAFNNVLAQISEMVPTKPIRGKSETIRWAISSGNQTENIEIDILNSTTLRIRYGDPKTTTYLHGNVAELTRKLLKLTPP